MKPLSSLLSAAVALCAWQAAPAAPEAITVSGRPVAEEIEGLDDLMRDYMDSNNITAGVLGVMQEGRIVYLRGFGEDYYGDPLPENALFRIASLTKPITAAVVRDLITKGELSLSDRAFDFGQAGGGVLDCLGEFAPWPAQSSILLESITVSHLLGHAGGWDRSLAGDLTYREVEIANAMAADPDESVGNPPGRVNTMRWILGQPLQFVPGTQRAYSNVGYLALGLIAEEVSGQDLISYLHEHILTPSMWVPSTELIQGHTFRLWQNWREPLYEDPATDTNVFFPGGSKVADPYGSWDHEARLGQGGIVTTAATMLTFADNYHVGTGSTNEAKFGGDQNTGQRFDLAPLANNRGHTGRLDGTRTGLGQYTDGYRVFVFLNKDDGGDHGRAVRDQVRTFLANNVIPTITQTSDGFWTEPDGGSGIATGGYHRPFNSFSEALNKTTAGSKIRLMAGSSDFTGLITTRLLIDAPEAPQKGSALIGLK